MYKYQAFQLTLQSTFEFPELCPLDENTQVDVTICYGEVAAEGIAAPLKKDSFFQAKPGVFWLNIPDVARFMVIEGKKIIVDPIPGIDAESVRVFLLGSCLGALLIQQGYCLIHGNVVQIAGEAVAFSGNSGAGKSTLAASFFKRGYSILADDICAINKKGMVIPGFPQLKLWADAARRLHIDTTGLRKIRPNFEKYAVPLGARFCAEALPLAAMYLLNIHNKDDVQFRSLTGLEKFHGFCSQLYRPQFAQAMGRFNVYSLQCATLAAGCDVVEIMRPAKGFQLDKLVAGIESDLLNKRKTLASITA